MEHLAEPVVYLVHMDLDPIQFWKVSLLLWDSKESRTVTCFLWISFLARDLYVHVWFPLTSLNQVPPSDSYLSESNQC